VRVGLLIEEDRFAPDSPLEGDGFEPSVPRVMGAWGTAGACQSSCTPEKSSSYQTPRWRKTDSNSRSLREGKGYGEPLQASIAVSGPNL
jgi:hypothetical protein